MGMLMIKCTLTGKAIATGVQARKEDVDKLPRVHSFSTCPHCRRAHPWTIKDARLLEDGSETAPD